MSTQPVVAVAMSGGVDSSVAAALLVEQGYPVFGLMLRLWSPDGCESDNRCCTPDAMAQARRVSAQLGIRFYAVDAREPFRAAVVESFLHRSAAGVTPNPCLLCNRHIRWGLLLDHARAMGAEFLATGHYARLETDGGGQPVLRKGLDEHKDQSYVLSLLQREQLAHTLLPIGGLTKPAVRRKAAELGLSVAQRPDSQDLCFLGGQDPAAFLAQHAPHTRQPGLIQTRDGEVLGEHPGLAFYTIGQRKGLGVASPVPLYVLEKRAQDNVLIVGTLDQLGHNQLTACGMNWIGAAPLRPFRAAVKIRYKAQPAAGWVHPDGEGRIDVLFDAPLRDITPGQAAVVYDGDRCLGGGWIQAASSQPSNPDHIQEQAG